MRTNALIVLILFLVGCGVRPVPQPRTLEDIQKLDAAHKARYTAAPQPTPRRFQGVAPYFIFHKRWKCDEMLAEYRKMPELAVSVLMDTPGNNRACFDKLVALPNLKAVEVHLINETCFPERGRKCQSHEVAHGYSIRSWQEAIRKKDHRLVARIQAAAARAAALTKRVRPDTELTISALLESNLGVAEGRVVIDLVRPYFKGRPATRFAWNPVKDVGRIEGTVYELHGFNPRLTAPCIYNNDGAIFEPVQAPYYLGKYPQCDSYYWTTGDNGNSKLYTSAEGFVPVPDRVGFNRTREFREIVSHVSKRTGPAPRAAAAPSDLKRCRSVRKVPDGEKRGFVWKQSEPANGGRRCGGKPVNGAVVIVDHGLSAKRLEALRNGTRIEQFCDGGNYSHDPKGKERRVWRSDKDTPQFPAGLTLISDKNVCWVLTAPAERID